MAGISQALGKDTTPTRETILKSWPMALAFITAFCYLIGFVRERAYERTLDLGALRSAAPKEEFVISGVLTLVTMIYPSVVAIATLLFIHFVLNALWGADRFKLSPRLVRLLKTVFRRIVPEPWRSTTLALAAFTLGTTVNVAFIAVMEWSRGLPLQHAPPAGPVSEFLWDTSLNSAWAALELASFTITASTVLLGWATTRIQHPGRRAVFAFAGLLLSASLVLHYAMLSGFTATIDRYPIVMFSGQEQFVGQNHMALLLGSDDQQYALLIVTRPGTKPDETSKSFRGVFYLPKKEVQWLAVAGHFPLYRLAHVYDYEGKSFLVPDQ